MADLPFSWILDLEFSKIKTIYGDRDNTIFPFESPNAVIKISKFKLGTVLSTTWSLQFEHAKVYDQSFYGIEEKAVLLLERNRSQGEANIKVNIGVYDLKYRKCLSTTQFECEMSSKQKVLNLGLNLSMQELSRAVFENIQLCIQGNFFITSNATDIAVDENVSRVANSSSVETHVVKNNSLVELSQDLRYMFERGKFSDLTLYCASKKFHVHRNIIFKRAPTFASMFSLEDDQWEVSDLDPIILTELLIFIYSGQITDFNFDLVCDLLFPADKYNLTELKTICIDYLQSQLSAYNAVGLLTLANYYDADLRDYVMDYISKNFSYFESTKEWKLLKKENKSLAIKVFKLSLQYSDEDTE